jgi:hypothetical protein
MQTAQAIRWIKETAHILKRRLANRWVMAGLAAFVTTAVLGVIVFSITRPHPAAAQNVVTGAWYGWGTEDTRHTAKGWFLTIQAGPDAESLVGTAETCRVLNGRVSYTQGLAVKGSMGANQVSLTVHDQASNTDYAFKGSVSGGLLTLGDSTGVHSPAKVMLRPGNEATFRTHCAPINA